MLPRIDRIAALAALLLACASPSIARAQEMQTLIDPTTYRGLVADRRAHRVGDALTIRVQEATRAKSQAATDASSRLDLDAGVRSPNVDYDAGLGLGGANTAVAQTTRLGELRTQVSARVVAIEPNGDLRIEGAQTLIVNGERQRIRITGSVRADDISADNSVWSNRIANANLELDGVGVVSESQRQSVLYRLFKWLRLI